MVQPSRQLYAEIASFFLLEIGNIFIPLDQKKILLQHFDAIVAFPNRVTRRIWQQIA